MSDYLSQPCNVGGLIRLSLKHYFKTLKLIFPLVLIAVLVKDLFLFFGLHPGNRMMFSLLNVLIVVLQVYIWSIAMFVVHALLKEVPVTLLRANRFVFGKLANIYLGVFGYILLLCAVFFVGFGIYKFVTWIVPNNNIVSMLVALLAIGIPINLCLLLFLLALPLLAIDPILPSFALRLSFQLVWWRNILKLLLLYAALVFLWMLTSVNTVHGQWLFRHHVNIIFNFVMLLLFTPLLVNYTLFLINDLQLRFKKA